VPVSGHLLYSLMSTTTNFNWSRCKVFYILMVQQTQSEWVEFRAQLRTLQTVEKTRTNCTSSYATSLGPHSKSTSSRRSTKTLGDPVQLATYCIYLSFCSASIFAEDFASKKSSLISSMSSLSIASLPLIFASRLAGVSSWTAYLFNTYYSA